MTLSCLGSRPQSTASLRRILLIRLCGTNRKGGLALLPKHNKYSYGLEEGSLYSVTNWWDLEKKKGSFADLPKTGHGSTMRLRAHPCATALLQLRTRWGRYDPRSNPPGGGNETLPGRHRCGNRPTPPTPHWARGCRKPPPRRSPAD